MGSAASVVSTDSDRDRVSPAENEPRTNLQEAHPASDLQSDLPPHPGPSHSAMSQSSRSTAHSERRSLATSRSSNSHYSIQHSRMSKPLSHLSMEDALSEEDSVGIPSPTPSISDEQKALVQECLSALEQGLVNSGVHLNIDRVLPCVEAITRRDDSIVDGEALLESRGMYIVQDGLLDVCAADGHTVTQRLQSGDFFGELSTLFRVPFNRKVNLVSSEVTLLRLPVDVVRECVSLDEGGRGFNKEVMLNWCVKKSYLESNEIFGHRVLSRKIVLSCLKASVLSGLSVGAMEFIADLVTPVLFEPGDVIYSTEEESNYIFLVLKGGVHILRGSDVVDSKSVRYSDEGYCLGHREFFSGVKLTHEVKAATPVTVALVSKEILLEMLNMFPDEVTTLKALLKMNK